nr:hypothetical protein [Tanacetum cinerariifolium]
MMIIVPVQGMNVEALQTTYLIIDWQIYTEGTRKYWKIIKDENHTEVHQFFDDTLKAFDRDDLVMMWSLVKEKFNSTEPTDDKERDIWVELKRLFKPDTYDELLSAVEVIAADMEVTYYCWFKLLLLVIVSTARVIHDKGLLTRNKPDLDTMSFNDLHNNFKIVEQEVKGITSSSSSSNSQNIAFVSSLSSTNEVNIAYGVSTANTQVSLAGTQVSPDSTANSSRRTVNVEEIAFKAMVAIDGAGFDWSYMAYDGVPTNMALMAFSNYELDLSNSSLEEFQQLKFEGYGPNTSNSISKDIFNEVKESPDAPLVKEFVSDDKLEKKTVFPIVAKIEFVRPKQQEKPVMYTKMYRLQCLMGNKKTGIIKSPNS